MTERLLTARQVAGQLGVSTETVLRWTRRGELPAFRLPGGAVRYREQDLAAWLEARATSDVPRGVSAAPDATRRQNEVSLVTSAVPRGSDTGRARTEEEP